VPTSPQVIFSTTDIHANEWSDPVYFDFPGYDTSISWDDDGKAYLVGSFYWRVGPHLFIPIATILRAARLDPTRAPALRDRPEDGQVAVGRASRTVRPCALHRNLRTDTLDRWAGMGGVGPEAPHIYKRHGKYYLMIAEGV
jgi:beta-xylosidase